MRMFVLLTCLGISTYSLALFSQTPSWSFVGLMGEYAYTIAFDPSNPQRIYAGTRDGLFISTDKGNSWNEVDLGTPVGTISAISVSKEQPSLVYVGTLKNNSGLSYGAFRTTDSGISWVPINNGLTLDPSGTCNEVIDISVVPMSPNTVFRAVFQDGIYESSNAGDTWQRSDNGMGTFAGTIYSMSPSPLSNGTVYAASELYGIWKTSDLGQNWNCVATGPPLGQLDVIVADSFDPSIVYAGQYYGLVMTQDAGLTWFDSSDGLNDQDGNPLPVFSIRPDRTTPGTLYVSTSAPLGVFKSSDYASHFRPVYSNSPMPVYINSIEIDPANPLALYAATSAGILMYLQLPSPTISSIKEVASPFALKIIGSHFYETTRVFIGSDSSPWGLVKYRTSSQLVLKGGNTLKAKFPKGLLVSVRVVNPDGGEATATFTR